MRGGFETEIGVINLSVAPKNCPVSTVEVLVRPEDVVFDEQSKIAGKLISESFSG